MVKLEFAVQTVRSHIALEDLTVRCLESGAQDWKHPVRPEQQVCRNCRPARHLRAMSLAESPLSDSQRSLRIHAARCNQAVDAQRSVRDESATTERGQILSMSI